jgi:biotin operon repressor
MIYNFSMRVLIVYYEELMEKLGFPGSKPSKRISEHLMTPEGARAATTLPSSVDEVAEKLSMEKSRVKDVLESLFRKGVAIPRDFKEKNHFRLARNIVQLHDATLASKHMRDPEVRSALEGIW